MRDQSHRDGGRVPAASGQSAEERLGGGDRIRMKWLRIIMPGVLHYFRLGHRIVGGTKPVTDMEIFEISFAHQVQLPQTRLGREKMTLASPSPPDRLCTAEKTARTATC